MTETCLYSVISLECEAVQALSNEKVRMNILMLIHIHIICVSTVNCQCLRMIDLNNNTLVYDSVAAAAQYQPLYLHNVFQGNHSPGLLRILNPMINNNG